MTGATLVVGLGRRDRADDGIGPGVVDVVSSRVPVGSGVRVVTEEDPAGLLDLWDGHDHVALVDAVVTGATPGTVHRFDVGAASPPLPGRLETQTALGGTHAFGLATAVELGRALHRLPRVLVVVGVEAACVEVGAALSASVAAAVEPATALVLEEVATHVPG